MAKKRLEVMVRLVDGSQMYWDSIQQVEPLTDEEIESLRPKGATPAELMAFDVKAAIQGKVKEKLMLAVEQAWERAKARMG